MKQIGKFGKSFLIFVCVMLAAALFTGCPKPTDGNEETTVNLTIKGDWPQGIKSISLVPSGSGSLGFYSDVLTLTSEKKSTTLKSSQAWNGVSFTAGTKVQLVIEPEKVNDAGYYEYYACIDGEEKPQVSVNDTKLTDTSTNLEIDLNTQPMGGTPNLKPTNLITGAYRNGSRDFYTQEFTLTQNNEISYSGLKKIELEKIKLKDSAGYCYVSAANLSEFDYYKETDYWERKVIADLKKQDTNERPVSICVKGEPYYWICETSTNYVLNVYGYENYKLDMTECTDFYVDYYKEYKIYVNAGPKQGELYKPTEGIKIEKIEDSLLTAKKLVSADPAIEINFSEGQKYTATIEGEDYSGVYKYKDECGTIAAELKITTDIGVTLGTLQKYGDTWAFYDSQDPNKDPVYFGKVIKISKNIGDVAPGQPFYLGTEFIGFETNPSTRKIHIKGLTDSDYNEEFTISESSTLELSGDDQLEPGRYVCTVSVEQDGKKYESNSGYLYVKKLNIIQDLNVQLGDIATIPIEMLYYSEPEGYYDNPYRSKSSPGFYIHLEGEGVNFTTQNPFPVKDGKIAFPTYGFSPTVKDGQLCPVDLWIEDSDYYVVSEDGKEVSKRLASNKVKITLNGPQGTISFSAIDGQTTAKVGQEVQMNVAIEGFTMADPWVMIFIQLGENQNIDVDDKNAITWHDESLPKYPDRNDFPVVNGKITFTIPEDALPEGQDSATYKLYVWACGIYSQSVDVTVTRD